MSFGPRILVIEEDRLFRGLLVSLLRKHGYDAEATSDGETGLSLLLDQRPDIVLLEVCLPHRDGLQILESVKSTPHLSDICTFIITGDLSHQTMAQCVELGADQYMVKARFTKEEFFSRFDELVETVRRKDSARETRFEEVATADLEPHYSHKKQNDGHIDRRLNLSSW